MRQARLALEQDHGRHLDDDELIAALAHGALDGDANGRARYQIVVERCDTCKRAVQHGAGARIAIDQAALDRAECDAQTIQHGRAKQDIPPATERAVRLRDHGRCRVPGCRSTRALEIHHIIHREHGGTHDPDNLALVCSSCHRAHHEGRLHITGTADHLEVARPAAHVSVRADAIAALTSLGFKPSIARASVDAALAETSRELSLEQLLVAALRYAAPR